MAICGRIEDHRGAVGLERLHGRGGGLMAVADLRGHAARRGRRLEDPVHAGRGQRRALERCLRPDRHRAVARMHGQHVQSARRSETRTGPGRGAVRPCSDGCRDASRARGRLRRRSRPREPPRARASPRRRRSRDPGRSRFPGYRACRPPAAAVRGHTREPRPSIDRRSGTSRARVGLESAKTGSTPDPSWDPRRA